MGMALTAQADTYPRKVLVEHFTTIRCGNCPYGNNVLSMATKDRNTVWVAHHVGFYTDELTADDSQTMLTFGISGAPYAMIDRSVWENNGLAVGIGYPNAASGAKVVGGYMDKASLVPANVDISISNNYNEETRDLAVTVSLERNADLPEDALLTVQIVEDDVYAYATQNGTTDEHIHNNVYRKSLTNILGDAITWQGNYFTKTYTLNIPNYWNAANTRVVAFVNHEQKRYEPAKNTIYNAEQSGTLIRSAEQAADPEFTPAAGTYTDEVEVTISAAEGAEIRYTTDGSIPNETSTVYTTPIKITENTTVKAVAYQSGLTPSEIVSARYLIESSGQTRAPEFTPAAGTYTDEVEVTISATEGAEIHYTTDGSAPDENSAVYTEPLKITESTTVKAVAYQDGLTPSKIVSAEYVIELSGIESITSDTQTEAEWFDLQGRPVNPESLTPGIYVKRTGNIARRVAVK